MKRSWYAAPYALWMVMFTVVPLLFVCYYAFTTKSGDFTMANLTKIFDYTPVLMDSLRLALWCTVLCLLIGYPAAWFMAGKEMSGKQSLVVLILLPMWMNFLLRTYAMMTLFENNGVLNSIFEALGLPKQTMIVTEWFHCDCIANYYDLETFSPKHCEYIGKFMRAAVDNGINAILTPVFTPPLDTAVGGERRTTQLVDVTKTEDGWEFGFSKLEQWVHLALAVGVEYFEIIISLYQAILDAARLCNMQIISAAFSVNIQHLSGDKKSFC